FRLFVLSLSFLFFSSRRRHTRFSRDWSSDVCSSDLIGFTGASIGAGTVGPIVIGGIIELTEGQWDAVTSQSGGLTPNSEYYLSNVTAGSITTSAPTSGVHAPVGIAISSTKLKIDPKRVVIL